VWERMPGHTASVASRMGVVVKRGSCAPVYSSNSSPGTDLMFADQDAAAHRNFDAPSRMQNEDAGGDLFVWTVCPVPSDGSRADREVISGAAGRGEMNAWSALWKDALGLHRRVASRAFLNIACLPRSFCGRDCRMAVCY
jgi:hypothetical protein